MHRTARCGLDLIRGGKPIRILRIIRRDINTADGGPRGKWSRGDLYGIILLPELGNRPRSAQSAAAIEFQLLRRVYCLVPHIRLRTRFYASIFPK